MKTIIPIKKIIMEFTAVSQYEHLVPKKSIARNNPIDPKENGSLTTAKTNATQIKPPKQNIVLDVMKETAKNQTNK